MASRDLHKVLEKFLGIVFMLFFFSLSLFAFEAPCMRCQNVPGVSVVCDVIVFSRFEIVLGVFGSIWFRNGVSPPWVSER